VAAHELGELLPTEAIFDLLRADGSPIDRSLTQMNLAQLPTVARYRELDVGVDNDAVGQRHLYGVLCHLLSPPTQPRYQVKYSPHIVAIVGEAGVTPAVADAGCAATDFRWWVDVADLAETTVEWLLRNGGR